MKRAGLVFLAVVISLFSTGVIAAPVMAQDIPATVEATPTTDDYWLKNPALIVSAYQRTADGSRLRVLELFNESSSLVNIEDWNISVVYGSATHELEIKRFQKDFGAIAPQTHVAIQFPDELLVENSSFVSTYSGDTSTTLLSKVLMSSRLPGVKTQAYDLKTSTSDKTAGSTSKYDDLWRRTTLTSPSYSSTLSSFSVSPALSIFDDGLYAAPASASEIRIKEIYPYAKDCAPDDIDEACFEYIELYVGGLSADELGQYVLRTDNNSASRTKSNTFYLEDYTDNINDSGYLVVDRTSDSGRLQLTNSGGYIWLEDLYGAVMYSETMTQYQSASSSRQAWSYMQDTSGVWKWTSTPTPGLENIFSEPEKPIILLTCPEGKYLNPDTNRCRTIEEAVNALAVCAEGQERNPLTNRCRKTESSASALVPCGEGQERNPLTNRCRSIASAVAELIPCNEGYERNPTTNRCRKVAGINTVMPAASLASSASDSNKEQSAMTGWILVGIAAFGALSYAVYEWRHEMKTCITRFASFVRNK